MGIAKAKKLYETAKSLGHANAIDFARKAESEEERKFFAYIADMNLQRAQRAVIEQEVAGNMSLSGFELTEKDKARIREFQEHPEHHDTMLQEQITKHSKRYSDEITLQRSDNT